MPAQKTLLQGMEQNYMLYADSDPSPTLRV
jgi:hypothetical protein